jgi:hypothetical protein
MCCERNKQCEKWKLLVSLWSEIGGLFDLLQAEWRKWGWQYISEKDNCNKYFFQIPWLMILPRTL